MANKTKLIFSVDTECSAGGWPHKKNAEPLGYDSMILCKIGTKEYGLRYIMDVLESYSFVADFFVEPLCSYKLGISQLKDICQEIIGRGHGVSLHLHPRWKLALNPTLPKPSDSFYNYGVDAQEVLIREGLSILSDCGAKFVSAFRAGNMHGNAETYEALYRVGIPFSSNFCGAWDDEISNRIGLSKNLNDAKVLKNGVIEIPVTSFHDFPRFSPHHLRPLQVESASLSEFKNVILDAIDKQYKYVVVLLHTFEWIVQKRDRSQKIDSTIIERFQALCCLLDNYREKIEVCRFGDIDAKALLADLEDQTQTFGSPLLSSDIAGANRLLHHSVKKILNKI